MTRNELKNAIIIKLNEVQRDQWGKGANRIQDVAEKVLPPYDFNQYLIKSNKDMETCEGSDFIVFNGQYFDWKQFDYMGPIILGAFLDYFTDRNLELIYNAM